MGSENNIFNRAGIGNVGSYQVTGYPFITGSTLAGSNAEQHVAFPLVAKKITVTSRGAGEINIHFVSLTAPGNVISGNHFLELSGSGNSVEINCKCKEIYISSPGSATEFDLFAELTTIGTEEMPILTGSGITE